MFRALELGVILVLILVNTSNLAGQMPDYLLESEEQDVLSIGQLISKVQVSNVLRADGQFAETHNYYIEQLFGNVKYLESFEYLIKNDEFGERLNSHSYKVFDRNKKLIQLDMYGSNDTLWNKANLIYDEHENLIRVLNYGFDDSLKSEAVYSYDKKGNLIKVRDRELKHNNRKYEEKGDVMELIGDEWWSFRYDEDGMKIEANLHNLDGSIREKHFFVYEDWSYEESFYGSYWHEMTFNYDEESVLTSINSSFQNRVYIYDEVNNVLIEEVRPINSPDKYVNYFTYDKNGNRLKISQPIWGGRTVYLTYNKKGDVIGEKTTRHIDGVENVVETKKYAYDEKGNVTEIESYNSAGNLLERITIKYEFDRMGNWVKKMRYENNTLVLVEERIIEYF